MHTTLQYLTSPQQFEGEATLLERGESPKGTYIILDQSLFYPRGGGQESDRGKIYLEEDEVMIDIAFVGFHEGKVYHFGEFPENCRLNQQLRMYVDAEFRAKNSALHSAGHLIASIAETQTDFLRAVKGFHFPNGSYVECILTKEAQIVGADIVAMLNAQLAKDIEAGLTIEAEEMTLAQIQERCTYVPSNLPTDKPLRVVTIDKYFPIPCGGTHLANIASLKGLKVYKAKKKKGNLKISYRIES